MAQVIEDIDVSKLHPWARNARTHSTKQIRQIADSIKLFGFTNPVLLDQNNRILAGHGRVEAVRLLGQSTVPCLRFEHLSEEEKRAYVLADNKLALNAGWDEELLALELTDLFNLDLDFDIGVTGFEVAEIDLIIGDQNAGGATEPEEAPLPDRSLPTVTKRGDLWLLGKHRVLCGDALNPADYLTLMAGDIADMGFTDPPYNVPIAGHVCGKGRVRHREFAQASGEMSSSEFESFLADAFTLGARHSRDGAVWFGCMDWRHLREMQAAGNAAFDIMLNLCVWAKTNGGMGSLYRSQHELVFVFRNGRQSHRNNVQLGKFGRNRTNVWTYAGVNVFRAGRMEELQAHPTAKPVAMVKDAILDVSARGDIVFDPFLGAGATVIAAERCGRIVRGLEIDPLYVDVVLRRWRKETGQEPVRASDNRTLASLEGASEEAGQ